MNRHRRSLRRRRAPTRSSEAWSKRSERHDGEAPTQSGFRNDPMVQPAQYVQQQPFSNPASGHDSTGHADAAGMPMQGDADATRHAADDGSARHGHVRSEHGRHADGRDARRRWRDLSRRPDALRSARLPLPAAVSATLPATDDDVAAGGRLPAAAATDALERLGRSVVDSSDRRRHGPRPAARRPRRRRHRAVRQHRRARSRTTTSAIRAGAQVRFAPKEAIFGQFTWFESSADDSLAAPTIPGGGGAVGSLVHHPGAALTASAGPVTGTYDIDFQLATSPTATTSLARAPAK